MRSFTVIVGLLVGAASALAQDADEPIAPAPPPESTTEESDLAPPDATTQPDDATEEPDDATEEPGDATEESGTATEEPGVMPATRFLGTGLQTTPRGIPVAPYLPSATRPGITLPGTMTTTPGGVVLPLPAGVPPALPMPLPPSVVPPR